MRLEMGYAFPEGKDPNSMTRNSFVSGTPFSSSSRSCRNPRFCEYLPSAGDGKEPAAARSHDHRTWSTGCAQTIADPAEVRYTICSPSL